MSLIAQEVFIRPLREEDASEIALLANNKKIFDQLRDFFPYPYTFDDARVHIQNCINLSPPSNFAIIYKNQIVGELGLKYQDDIYSYSAELGYWIGEDFWGLGIATEAIAKGVSFAFEEVDLHRVYASIFSFNSASIRVLEKNGFTREGHLKESAYKNGKFVDEILMAIRTKTV